jgi:phosphoesterase RecJ-like protein
LIARTTGFPLENADFQNIRKIIQVPSRMIIVTHTNPDGDAVGASLAMYLYLVSKGHQVSLIIQDHIG